jgi:ABC-type multidrug transport system fused ATPase/permease subunit
VLVQDPVIVIMDEPTSSLDSVTESFVTESMATFLRGKTVVVIAHRLQTIREADKIIVLEDGAVIQEGRFDALIATGGKFRELWEEQTAVSPSTIPVEEINREQR